MKMFFVITLLGMMCVGYSQDEDEEIQGVAKEMKIQVYNAKLKSGKVVQDGLRSGNFKTSVYIIFNKYGNQVNKYYSYDFENGTFDFATQYYYYKGNLVEMKTLSEDKNPSYVYKYVYDNKKQLLASYEYDYHVSGKEKGREEYTYNNNGQLINQKSFYWKELTNEKTFSYNSDGNRNKSKTVYVRQKNAITKSEFKYDDKGNKIESKGWCQYEGKKGFEYDKKEYYYLANHFVYSYDQNNRKIEESRIDREGKYMYKRTWKYDDYGNITEESKYLKNGYLKEHKRMIYKYDSKNNWIKKIVFYKNQPSIIVLREITY